MGGLLQVRCVIVDSGLGLLHELRGLIHDKMLRVLLGIERLIKVVVDVVGRNWMRMDVLLGVSVNGRRSM